MTEVYNYVKHCPDCEGESIVVDSREREDGAIIRRRECTKCGFRYTTAEVEEMMVDEKTINENARLRARIERLEAYIDRIRVAVDSW